MREMKIRVWDNLNEIMSHGEQEIFDDMIGWRFNHFNIDSDSEKELIIMLFTGLKDKNCKDIFEGDIVKIIEPGYDMMCSDNEYVTEVKYISGGFSPFNNVCKETMHFDNYEQGKILADCLAQFEEYSVEVIGNIYETPDLLCGKS